MRVNSCDLVDASDADINRPDFNRLSFFQNNPCPHPIIFMRDCEVSHVRALLQFMYVGQVNIAQAQLSAFLRTADALQIRGLTDCSQHNDKVRSRTGKLATLNRREIL